MRSFFGENRLANGAPIRHMAYKIRAVMERTYVAQLLVKLNGGFFAKCCVPASFCSENKVC